MFFYIFFTSIAIAQLALAYVLYQRTQQSIALQQDKLSDISSTLNSHSQILPQLDQALQKIQLNQERYEKNLNEQTHFNHQYSEKIQKILFENHEKTTSHLHNHMQSSLHAIQKQVTHELDRQNKTLNAMQSAIAQQLDLLNRQVEQKLNDGLAKTNALFADMIKRLSLIDQAQQKITELSHHVVSLQDILNNKQSRGHYGEVQLAQIIQNALPKAHYAFQHVLLNGRRCDCILFLPEPTGPIIIDAKFPLENYKRLKYATQDEKNKFIKAFKQDVKTHIAHIKERYVGVDSEQAALMFLPAESIFAEIHDHHVDLIELAYQSKVWLVSPTTLMAILHTVQAVLKDIQTQKQVHIIKHHLSKLAEDFSRFQTRMDQVAKHMNDANEKVRHVHISASKIATRFNKIEQCELESDIPIDKITETIQ